MERTHDELNKMLRGELSATETYRQALDKIRGEFGQDARFAQLAQMLQHHEQTATQLRTMIQETGGSASNDSGAWGTWSKAVMGTAKLLGDKSALKALKEGEESGLKDWESVSPDVRNRFSSQITRQQDHIRQLDRMIEAA